ncbi:MAG: DUF898 family protein [Brevundimonas sp.]|nr:DUF898 family protein [Brevundimonas sp.]
MTDIFAETTPEVEAEGEALTFTTTLRPSGFLGLSLKNGLLNLITLTLYRFWGKTEVRHRVWKGVRLNGEAFEYTGRGVELFIGFLLASVVLGVPFLVVVFAVQFGAEWMILFLLPMYIALPWLWGFGVFTAFRYMASRTTWRGIRFSLKGSAVNYGWLFLGVGILDGITMGWFRPAGERMLAEKIWDEVRFGDRRLRFRMARSQREGIYGPFAIGWVGTGVGFLLVTFIFIAILAATGDFSDPNSLSTPESDFAAMAIIYGVMLLLSPFALLIWAPYHAALLRSIAAGVSVDGASFRLEVRALSLWWLMISNLFMLLITFGFLMPWVQARTARYLITRLKSEGTARLNLAQQAERGPGTGEGLADAFGFSAI